MAVVVSATGHVSAQKAASKVNYCLSSALQITSVQDLKNVVFEECIHQQIKNEEVSLILWMGYMQGSNQLLGIVIFPVFSFIWGESFLASLALSRFKPKMNYVYVIN